MNGYFNPDGHPAFKIQVFGYHPNWMVGTEAILDTGFSGFLSLPLHYCLQAGLVLASTAEYILADGSVDKTLLCWGTIIINSQKITGLVSISFKGKQPLIGIEFLRKINKKLELDFKLKKVNLS